MIKKIKYIKCLGILLVVLLGLVTAYYVNEVVQARAITPDLTRQLTRPENIKLRVEELPEGWLEILLKVEDPEFFNHNGMDLRTPGAGLTTITQGMVKYLYFDNFKPGLAKLRQTLIAVFALNALAPKEVQLLIFLNTVYLGHPEGKAVKGFPEGAGVYFEKEFHELTEDEFISLVAMIIGPNYFDPIKHPEANRLRVVRIRNLINGEYKPTGLMDLYYDRD